MHTLQLKSRARLFASLDNVEALPSLIEHADSKGLAVVPIGQGSNIVPAREVDALVVGLALQGQRVLDDSDDFIRLQVQAGENWHALVERCVAEHWYGLENLALIPGLVGAAPIQNIGAYGVEVASCVESVQIAPLDRRAIAGLASARGWQCNAQGIYSLTKQQCEFAYRDSLFKGALKGLCIVVSLVLRLSKRYQPELAYPALANHLGIAGRSNAALPCARQVFDAVVAIRREKLPDPARVPNAGSFFHNPVVSAALANELQQRHPALPMYAVPGATDKRKLAAAWLIEYCGFKGREGAAVGMYAKQALVLVNHQPGRASADDVLSLAAEIVKAVEAAFGVRLQREPELIGA
ncbi:MAG: UDP-N-acetylmuramate dehydrogenase [Gammaproteobacteria bacterium]|nr:UDP-N-acetylmuramate dehydrogenase [Gammaproteobacteria bacterium]NND39116.1 UDP-N-acetylmuramate dehydrogenase [Pseudomonadales bacterium]NNM12361.1 UDP-N-acetylmuramate dehydrogenase [Pseudomonadales bacterium]